MQNALLHHESDFKAWVDSHFLPSQEATQNYLAFLADPETEVEPKDGGLWPHQWDALLRVVYAREVLNRNFWGDGLLLNVVTGGGKTALIAATMVWLRLAYDVQRFLILCPNLIVRDRLESDFLNGKVFDDRGLIPLDAPFKADAFALTTLGGSSSAAKQDLFGAKVVLSNIHQFYRGSKTGQDNLWALFGAQQTPFGIFNDEAHNTPADEYERTLTDLQSQEGFAFRLDTTATPDRADGKPVDSRMVYEYDIPEALHDDIIAKPVVYQPNIETVELTYTNADTGEKRSVEEIDWDEVDRAGLSATQWVTDPKPMSQQISIALQRLKEAKRNANGRYRPILFVVAVCKADAWNAKDMLEREFGLRALIVTEDENEQARADAATVAREGRYDAVVSVAMLREGWDVPEVAVILLLRKFSSEVYGPQVVGRGLRRVRLPSVPDDEPQICAVVDHPKLGHEWLWTLLHARVRTEVGVQQEFDELAERGEPPPRQRIVNPDLIIEVPQPDADESLVLAPVTAAPSPKPSPDWLQLLDALDFDERSVEITDVTLSGVTGRELSQGSWVRHTSAPAPVDAGETANLSAGELREKIRERLHEMGERLTINAGYSTLMQRHVDRPVREFIERRFLDGEPLAFAEEPALRRAAARLNQLETLLDGRTDIIGGMVEYAGN